MSKPLGELNRSVRVCLQWVLFSGLGGEPNVFADVDCDFRAPRPGFALFSCRPRAPMARQPTGPMRAGLILCATIGCQTHVAAILPRRAVAEGALVGPSRHHEESDRSGTGP